jgi:hypothetical protein
MRVGCQRQRGIHDLLTIKRNSDETMIIGLPAEAEDPN